MIRMSNGQMAAAIVAVTLACATEPNNTLNWEALGLEGRFVTALAQTPAGLLAGTRFSGLFRLDEPSGSWTHLGLDEAPISSIAYVPGSQGGIFVATHPYSSERISAAIWYSED